MIVVCAIDRPRSTIISTRSRKLSLKRRYQRTHRMTTSRSKWLEQLFYSLQFGHCRPRLVQHASVADRTVPFAPEPDFPGVIPEIDIWRAATLLLKRYGDKALDQSAMRAQELADGGDHDGADTWRRIT